MEHEPKYSPGIKQKYIKNAVLTKVGYQAAGKLENKKCTWNHISKVIDNA